MKVTGFGFARLYEAIALAGNDQSSWLRIYGLLFMVSGFGFRVEGRGFAHLYEAIALAGNDQLLFLHDRLPCSEAGSYLRVIDFCIIQL